MYGPGSRDPPVGGRGGGDRKMTPRGQMSAGANQRPPLSDLPPNMKMMFEPRPPLPHKPPMTKRKMPPYTGISQYIPLFEKETPEKPIVENPKERKKRLSEQLMKSNQEKNELLIIDWDPKRNFKATENAYSTLFIARLSYDTSEKKLRREFEQYGPIRTVKLVLDNNGKPRGYAFIEFEREEDMTMAYKRADGKKIDGRRILVDVERGRTVQKWRPRRFGGGLGGRRPQKSKKEIAEEQLKALQENATRSAYAPPPDRGARDRGRDSGGARRSRSRDRREDRSREDRSRGSGRSRERGGRDRPRDDSRARGGESHYGPPDRKRARSRDRDGDRSSSRRRRSRSPGRGERRPY
mmetsp:Transcript_1298/g.2110  ORF Transcript_1298/g.2110 Transcript_1298/m.2110 type:complete len:353 (-) Transcript_1298:304-1362(-)